jgi:histidinol-phosphate aminotransferase
MVAETVPGASGGDELLRLAVTTFVEPGLAVGMVEPSYSLYPVLAAIHGSPLIRVSAAEDWSLPADFARRMNDGQARLVFLVNPHAPSGHLLPASAVAEIASELKGVLLVDEAYVDFVDPELEHDLVPLIDRFPNLLLLRTLSKGYSLAGLRFGYGLGSASLVEPVLTKTRDTYNVDAVAQVLAVAALEHRSRAELTWRMVREERERLRRELIDLGFQTPPSQSNFLLARAGGQAARAAELHRELERRGILVRHFDEGRLSGALRITVGAREQNDRLLAALREMVRGNEA